MKLKNMLHQKEKYLKEINSIKKILKYLYLRGLISGSEGNISIRKGDSILITASGVHKGLITTSDFVVVKDNKIIGIKKPSIELAFHRAIYRADPFAKAVIHTHPPYLLALYAKGLSLAPFKTSEEKALFENKIIELPYLPAGSHQLASEIEKHAKDFYIFILKDHGLVVKEKNLKLALIITEALEHNAKIKFLSSLLPF